MKNSIISLLILWFFNGNLYAGMTLIHSTPLDFKNARVEGPRPIPFEQGVFAGSGTIESPVLPAAFPFDNLVGSWNADLPPGSAIELQVQVLAGGTWSSWYRLGRWDKKDGQSLGPQEDALGKMDIDELKLKKKATAMRYRVVMEKQGTRAPRLRLVALTYIDSTLAPDPSTRPFQSGPWVRELHVRSRSQKDEEDKYKHDICSPTSLSMVLDFWGKPMATMNVVKKVQDQDSQLYGNWTINVAAAALWGLSGYAARLSTLEELQELIASGKPIIVSIAFPEGGLTGAPIRKTKGHLFVVTGFTKTGDVIVQDPAGPSKAPSPAPFETASKGANAAGSPDNAGVRRVYRRDEFAKVWLEAKRGLAYVLGPRFPQEMEVGIPTADLRHHPKHPKTLTADDPDLGTQVLYGERVLVLKARSDWALVEAEEQPHWNGRRWSGYPGWVESRALARLALPPQANAVVRAKRAHLKPDGGEGEIVASMGTRLRADSNDGLQARIRLLDGRTAIVGAAALKAALSPGQTPSAGGILLAASQFMGDAYVWGGHSSIQPNPAWGVDCSGLISLSYRAEGMEIPRDAKDQYLRAAPIRRAKLAPGDLIFLAQPGTNRSITHVMLYEGGDTFVESQQGAAKTVRTTFQQRFGVSLSKIESGSTVMDSMRTPKAASRKIYFGSFLHK